MHFQNYRMEYHKKELEKACRVCGKRVKKAKGRDRNYSVAEFSKELAEMFGIDASKDSKDTHPLSFCHCCRTFMRSWHDREVDAPSVGRVFTWTKHIEPDCTVSNLTSPIQFRNTTCLLGLPSFRLPPNWRRQNW